MENYKIKQIHPWLYSIADPDNVFCYLLVGDKEALLYDTANGTDFIPDIIAKVTDKPVTVVLSHAHPDHSFGAWQFGEVYLHKSEFADYERFAKNQEKRAELKELRPGHVFDLGNLTAEVIPMEGHTPGSMSLLVKELKVLFTGDASNPHIWLFLDNSSSVPDYIAMLKRTAKLDFDTFFIGHGDNERPKSEFMKYITVAENSIKNKDKATKWHPEWDGVKREDFKAYLYEEDGVGIRFR